MQSNTSVTSNNSTPQSAPAPSFERNTNVSPHQLHLRHAKKAKISTCAAYHLTFGGHCLNCGFNPSI